MIKLDNAIDKLIFNLTVKAMLDPNNAYFYLPNLTDDKIKELCTDKDKTEMFWKCYNYAYSTLYPEDISYDIVCPECGCKHYIDGIRCPNCDFIK